MIKSVTFLISIFLFASIASAQEDSQIDGLEAAERAIKREDYRLIQIAYQLARVVEGLQCKDRVPGEIIKKVYYYSDMVSEMTDASNAYDYKYAVSYNQKIASSENYPHNQYCTLPQE